MKISILINNFNKSKFIKQTLQSCINQTDKNFEIIIFDDASTDESIFLIKESLKNLNSLQYKIIERKGEKSRHNSFNQITAIKNSLDKSEGEYISFLDADDLFDKYKIEYLREKFKNKKIIYNSYNILKENYLEKNQRHFKKRKIIWPIFPPTSCLSIEKKLLLKFFDKICIQKFSSCWFDFRIASFVSKYVYEEIHYTKKELTTYRKLDDSNDTIYTNPFKFLFWKRKVDAFILHRYF